MAVYTPVSPEELDSFLARYGLPPATRFEGIAGGIENTNYRVFTGGRRLILTLYEGRTAPEDLPYFLALMGHVARAGASAAAPLENSRGETLGRLAGKPAALVVHLDGADAPDPTPRQAEAAGRALADFHWATRDFDQARPNALGPAAWRDAGARLDLERLLPGEAATIRDRLCAIEAAWAETVRPRLPAGTIHADLFPDNVLFEGDTVTGVIDLYFACTDALAYDLGVAMASWTPEAWSGAPDPSNARALRAGYEAVRPLTQAESDALPLLIEGAAWRFFLTRAEDWLSPRRSLAGRIKDPLPFFRLARHVRTDPTHLTETR